MAKVLATSLIVGVEGEDEPVTYEAGTPLSKVKGLSKVEKDHLVEIGSAMEQRQYVRDFGYKTVVEDEDEDEESEEEDESDEDEA